MATITVTGNMRAPRYIEEKLASLTTVKECRQRQAAITSQQRSLREEIEGLESEQGELETEEFWLQARVKQIIEDNPAEAENWALEQAIKNPNQLRLDTLAAPKGGTQ